MPYTPKGYTDKEAVEKYMLIDIDDQFDDKVDEWVCVAENIIDQETNRDFTPAGSDGDYVFDGDGTDTLYIGSFSDVDSVKINGADSDPIDADQYLLYPANSSIKTKIKLKYLVFPEGLQNIIVNGTNGNGDVPADIKHAATVLVAGIIRNAWDDSGEIQSMTIGRYTVSYKTKEQKNDLENVQDILDRNKRYSF